MILKRKRKGRKKDLIVNFELLDTPNKQDALHETTGMRRRGLVKDNQKCGKYVIRTKIQCEWNEL